MNLPTNPPPLRKSIFSVSLRRAVEFLDNDCGIVLLVVADQRSLVSAVPEERQRHLDFLLGPGGAHHRQHPQGSFAARED